MTHLTSKAWKKHSGFAAQWPKIPKNADVQAKFSEYMYK